LSFPKPFNEIFTVVFESITIIRINIGEFQQTTNRRISNDLVCFSALRDSPLEMSDHRHVGERRAGDARRGGTRSSSDDFHGADADTTTAAAQIHARAHGHPMRAGTRFRDGNENGLTSRGKHAGPRGPSKAGGTLFAKERRSSVMVTNAARRTTVVGNRTRHTGDGRPTRRGGQGENGGRVAGRSEGAAFRATTSPARSRDEGTKSDDDGRPEAPPPLCARVRPVFACFALEFQTDKYVPVRSFQTVAVPRSNNQRYDDDGLSYRSSHSKHDLVFQKSSCLDYMYTCYW